MCGPSPWSLSNSCQGCFAVIEQWNDKVKMGFQEDSRPNTGWSRCWWRRGGHISEQPGSFSVGVDLCQIDSLQIKNVYGRLFALKNCCCSRQWNFVISAEMDKESSSWISSKGVQHLSVWKGITCEVVLWYELFKKGIMLFVCWQASDSFVKNCASVLLWTVCLEPSELWLICHLDYFWKIL